MINKDFQIATIIARLLTGEITPEENAELTRWRRQSNEHEVLFQKICNEENQKLHLERAAQFNPTAGWEKIKKQRKINNTKARIFTLLRYAAIILLPLLLVRISVKYVSTDNWHSDQQIAQATYPILPGEAKAILTLDDGETIDLDKQANNEALQKLNEKNIQADSTMLNYQSVQQNLASSALAYNKIEIPQGGEYALILSDGTKVHLNSMSSLRFPVTFANGKREVELEGEAYFEVSKTGQPFIVNSNGTQVEVLGTAFNISAYPNEEYQTTLVNGSVKVNTNTGESLVLKPSQQASIAQGSRSIRVRTVDTAFYTSWTKGKIYFKDQRLEDIMKILSRWYDIKVAYSNESIKNIRFGCNVDRYSEITPFVDLLERTERVNVTIKDKTILFHN